MLLNSIFSNPLVFIPVILVVLGAICLISFLLYKYVLKKNKPTEVKDEKEIIEEELNRVLETVEDEETADKIKNFNQNDD